MNYTDMLLKRGFILNQYKEGKYWEYETTDILLIEKLCHIFGAIIDLGVDGPDINTLILQCTEDFGKCIFYYDCNTYEMDTSEFLSCVSKMEVLI